MQSCLLTVTAPVGTGVQTVTGVVDALGASFVPLGVMVVGFSTLNTLKSVASNGDTGYKMSRGLDDLSRHYGLGVEEVQISSSKILTSASAESFSLIDAKAQLAFGGAIAREAYVSAARLGELDITYTLNTRAGDSFLLLVFGGSDLSLQVSHVTTTGNAITGLSFAPIAILMVGQTVPGPSTGAGGGDCRIGWSARNSGHGFGLSFAGNQGANARSQRTDFTMGSWTGTPPSGYTLLSNVSSWNSDGLTWSGGTAANASMLFGGTALQAAAGTLTQPLATGVQETVVGFAPAAVILQSVGAPATTAILSDQAEQVVGLMDGTRGGSCWTAESTVGNVAPLKGVRYLSNADVLRFATANGASTTFAARASSAGFSVNNGSFSLDWTVVDGVQRQVLWLALGPSTVPPTPPVSVVYPIRRLRRFLIAYDTNLEIRLRRLEFLVQPATGLTSGQGSDPVLMFRLSKDGGFSWGAIQHLHIGQMGDTLARAYVLAQGMGRQLVGEISSSDPTTFALINCLADLDVGWS